MIARVYRTDERAVKTADIILSAERLGGHDDRQGQHLDEWITIVRADPLPALHSFTNGLGRPPCRPGRPDPPYSGPVEGMICKMLKRLVDGRASGDLLRKMALLNGTTECDRHPESAPEPEICGPEPA
jgi:hypothetical protein